jgi:hypothetical protein
MVDESRPHTSLADCHRQRVQGELLIGSGTHGPSNHAPGTQI